ncbi:50S ribosomal protein L15 [Candidatus Woesearchaeota archaeon]|nr:50S ribosomal protein L15 [Candidatus Woesearchaeota archaeon]
MVARKKKKSLKFRGSKTHGWGSMKKNRGAGHRGGRGMAGTGKKGDAKKPKIWDNKKYFGKYGFKKKNITVRIKTISIKELEDTVPSLLKKGTAKEESGRHKINLDDIGCNKLLGSGKATKRWSITVRFASKDAVEKIKKAGGEVLGLESKEEKPATASEEGKKTQKKEAPETATDISEPEE